MYIFEEIYKSQGRNDRFAAKVSRLGITSIKMDIRLGDFVTSLARARHPKLERSFSMTYKVTRYHCRRRLKYVAINTRCRRAKRESLPDISAIIM